MSIKPVHQHDKEIDGYLAAQSQHHYLDPTDETGIQGRIQVRIDALRKNVPIIGYEVVSDNGTRIIKMVFTSESGVCLCDGKMYEDDISEVISAFQMMQQLIKDKETPL